VLAVRTVGVSTPSHPISTAAVIMVCKSVVLTVVCSLDLGMAEFVNICFGISDKRRRGDDMYSVQHQSRWEVIQPSAGHTLFRNP
jgi:hypothetical protein